MSRNPSGNFGNDSDTSAWRVDRLISLREGKGWSQRELARLCGIADSLIPKYESGATIPSIITLRRMAVIFDVSTDYLLGATDEPRGHLGDGELSDDEQTFLETFRREGWPGVIKFGVDQLVK